MDTEKMNPLYWMEQFREGMSKMMGLEQESISRNIGASMETMQKMMGDAKSMSHEMAIGLAKYFKTTSDFWAAIQKGVNPFFQDK
jgi:plasmid maintenance system antidote protein VapI